MAGISPVTSIGNTYITDGWVCYTACWTDVTTLVALCGAVYQDPDTGLYYSPVYNQWIDPGITHGDPGGLVADPTAGCTDAEWAPPPPPVPP